MTSSSNAMPQFPEPYWREVTLPPFEKLTKNLSVILLLSEEELPVLQQVIYCVRKD